MSITTAQIATVQQSFERLMRHMDTNSAYFYEALFRHAPELRPMFREDLTGQGMKFMTTLEAIVQRLGDPDAIEAQYTGLGRTHRSLGVEARHFAPMEEALIDTMREVLGADFDAGIESAWREAFRTVSANMIRRGNIPD